MKPERWAQVRDIFESALELEPEARPIFIAQACGSNAELRAEVLSLLAVHERAGNSFLEQAATRPITLAAGVKLGSYEILMFVGAGGMGEVYKARDPILGRDVAIKILPSVFSSDPDRARRFEQEARAAAALNHPNILSIHQLGNEDGSLYIVSEFLDGETLRVHLQRGPIPVQAAIDYMQQLLNGLAAAHEKGVVHRDLKPENLFLTQSGWLKILDFGLAKLHSPLEPGSPEIAAGAAGKTAPGIIMGTVGYMSPEQVRGSSVDHRSDIFAAGSIFYEMLSGQRAFKGDTAADTMTAILTQDPAPLRINTSIVPALDEVIRRCVNKDPTYRFQSAREVEGSLKRLQITRSMTAPVRVPLEQSRWRHRNSMLVAVSALAILVFLLTISIPKVRNGFGSSAGLPQIHSLVVLPLTNLSGDPAQEYFADGLTEAMTTELAQISALRVISRTSAMHYKGGKKTVPEIARELHVDGVLEGSVLQSGGKVRITTQLIQATPERHLWARSYERKLRDIMAIEADVAASVAQEIRIKLTPREEAQLRKSDSVNPDAHDAYLRARYYRQKGNPKDLEKARQYFEEALDKDPLYAPAYAGLADYYSVLPFYTNVSSDDVRAKAKAAVRKALELDDSLADAHAELAYIDSYYEWSWAEADREFQRALQLNPNDANVRHRYSRYLATLGRIDEALQELRYAQELDPLSLIAEANVGVIYYFGRQYDSAMRALQDVSKRDPKFDTAYWGLGLVYEQKGMPLKAVAQIEKAAALSRDSNTIASLGHAYAIAGQTQKAEKLLTELETLKKQEAVSGYQFALIYVGLRQNDQAFSALESAFQERSTLLPYIKMDPRFDPLRLDPRFRAILTRMGMPL